MSASVRPARRLGGGETAGKTGWGGARERTVLGELSAENVLSSAGVSRARNVDDGQRR